MKEYNVVSKEEKLNQWGEGEWVNEPDFQEWTYREYTCIARRMMCYEGFNGKHLSLGQWNGYVVLKENHPWFGKDAFKEIEADVHGGLTFGELINPVTYMIGFDCAHSTDIVPSMKKTFDEIYQNEESSFLKQHKDEMKEVFPEGSIFNPTYKNLNFVKCECESLVDQAILAEKGETIVKEEKSSDI